MILPSASWTTSYKAPALDLPRLIRPDESTGVRRWKGSGALILLLESPHIGTVPHAVYHRKLPIQAPNHETPALAIHLK